MIPPSFHKGYLPAFRNAFPTRASVQPKFGQDEVILRAALEKPLPPFTLSLLDKVFDALDIELDNPPKLQEVRKEPMAPGMVPDYRFHVDFEMAGKQYELVLSPRYNDGSPENRLNWRDWLTGSDSQPSHLYLSLTSRDGKPIYREPTKPHREVRTFDIYVDFPALGKAHDQEPSLGLHYNINDGYANVKIADYREFYQKLTSVFTRLIGELAAQSGGKLPITLERLLLPPG